jgi:hypothetical protein
MADSRICSVEGCGKKHKARGLCNAHYHRHARHNDPLAGATEQGAPIAFIIAAGSSTTNECIVWPFATLPNGYGHLWVNGVDVLASRLICERAWGPPPSDGHEAAHSCGNGRLGCIQPRHLSWKTHSENERDKLDHGTDNRGEKHCSAILTEHNVHEILSLKGRMTAREAGEIFGVTRWTIYKIWSRKIWSWLEAKPATPL